jgi:hypothetical protein
MLNTNEVSPAIQAPAELTCAYILVQTDRHLIPETTCSYREGLKTCKSVSVSRSIFHDRSNFSYKLCVKGKGKEAIPVTGREGP